MYYLFCLRDRYEEEFILVLLLLLLLFGLTTVSDWWYVIEPVPPLGGFDWLDPITLFSHTSLPVMVFYKGIDWGGDIYSLESN